MGNVKGFLKKHLQNPHWTVHFDVGYFRESVHFWAGPDFKIAQIPFFFKTNNCMTFTKSLLWACFLTCKTYVHTCIHTHWFQMVSKTIEWDNKVKALAQCLALSNYSVLFHWTCYFWTWYLLTITKLLQGQINGIGLKLMKSEKSSIERGTEVEQLDEKLVSRVYLPLKLSSLLKL